VTSDRPRSTPGRVAAGNARGAQVAGAVPPPIEVQSVDAIEREPPGGAKLVKVSWQ